MLHFKLTLLVLINIIRLGLPGSNEDKQGLLGLPRALMIREKNSTKGEENSTKGRKKLNKREKKTQQQVD